MPAPAGNCFNPHGRPRDLSREVARLEEAAAHVEALAQQAALIAVLDRPVHGGDELIEAAHRRRVDTLLTDARHLRSLVERMRGAAQELPPGRSRRRRKRHPNGVPIIHATRFAQDVATAVLALDRLLPKGTA